MEQQLELIREQQRASWNKFSPGWKKWDELFMDFLKMAKKKTKKPLLNSSGFLGSYRNCSRKACISNDGIGSCYFRVRINLLYSLIMAS